ncbi:hypothetical protein Mapa_012928 [Marchantia paleacea]|nr:hypothetical protein Mapa_012928 [Marchantia paleacea]
MDPKTMARCRPNHIIQISAMEGMDVAAVLSLKGILLLKISTNVSRRRIHATAAIAGSS